MLRAAERKEGRKEERASWRMDKQPRANQDIADYVEGEGEARSAAESFMHSRLLLALLLLGRVSVCGGTSFCSLFPP